MPQIGPLEILIVAVLALVVLGPEKLPEVARSIGKFMSEMRRVAHDVRTEFTTGLEEDTDDDPPPARDDEAVADEDSDAIENAAPRPSSED